MSNRWLIPLATSIVLHFAVLAILGTFIHSSAKSLGQSAGLPDVLLTVNITQPEKQKLPPAFHPRLASMQVSRNSNAHFDVQNPDQGGVASPQYMGLAGIYFSTPELDVIPEIRRDIDLYPQELHNFIHDGGKAVLRLWIDENGSVVKVEPVSSDLPPIFIEAAARAFMQADFRPGRKNGFAVKSKVDTALFYPSRSSNQ